MSTASRLAGAVLIIQTALAKACCNRKRKPSRGSASTDPRNKQLFRQNLELDCGIGGRDRDRTVEGSTSLVSIDHLARVRLTHARHYEFHPGALEYRRSFILRLRVDHPF